MRLIVFLIVLLIVSVGTITCILLKPANDQKPVEAQSAKKNIEPDDDTPAPKTKAEEDEAEAKAREIRVAAARSTIQNYFEAKQNAEHSFTNKAEIEKTLSRITELDKECALELRENRLQSARNRALAASKILRDYDHAAVSSHANKNDLEIAIHTHMNCLASICKDDSSLEAPYSEMIFCKSMLGRLRKKNGSEEKSPQMAVAELHARLNAEDAILDFYECGDSQDKSAVAVLTKRDLRWIDLGLPAAIEKDPTLLADTLKKVLGKSANRFYIAGTTDFENLPWKNILPTGASNPKFISSPEELLFLKNL